MTDRAQLEAHLEFFRELGVEGVSRDPAWRRRPDEGPAAVAPPMTDAGGPLTPAADAGETVARAAEALGPDAHEVDVLGPDVHAAEAVAAAAAGEAPGREESRAAGSGSAAPPPGSAPPGNVASPPGSAPPGNVAPPPASGAVALSMFDQVRAPAEGSPRERLDHVREQLGPCTRCKLHAGRTTLVFGVGNPDADLMFVGEAPGRDEDREGIPFVGRAGQLLTRIIEAIDLRRDDVYIANVIKCRPPDNRNPEPDEVQTCEPYLFAQIDCIRPRVIVALGSFAARTLLRDDRASITKIRGNVYGFRGAQLIPTFHPAFLLRSPDRKREVWEDMKLVRSLLRG